MKKTGIIVAVVIAIVLIIGVVMFGGKMYGNPSTSNNTKSSSATAAATITYSDSGFSPAMTTVKSGDTVAITNNSSSAIQVDSDPHPVHTDDTDLNVGVVNPGETKKFTVTKKGAFGLHNHLAPSNQAKITIE